MNDLSICQEYLLLTLNNKGKIPALNTSIPVCFFAGGLLDLIISDTLAIDKVKKVKKVCIIGELKHEYQYLTSLYSFIKESKSIKINKLVSDYALSLTSKRLNLLIESVGESLVENGCAVAKKGGIVGNNTYFIPNAKAIDRVIQKIRAELLENGTISDNTVALVSLLNKSNQIKKYFSKYEKEQLKSRLKEIKETSSNQLVKEIVDYVDTIIAVIAATSGSS